MVKMAADEETKKRAQAERLLHKGRTPVEIALTVGVARQTLYAEKMMFGEGGMDSWPPYLCRAVRLSSMKCVRYCEKSN